MNNDKIKDFYNDFVSYQTQSGVNERIYTLYKKMQSLGLNSDSNILELGCGIGVMTKLLTNSVKTGYIESVDLSDKSIELAKSKIHKQNVSFYTDDVVSYQPKKKKRVRKHGFMKRMASSGGIRVLKRRRAIGRLRLSI